MESLILFETSALHSDLSVEDIRIGSRGYSHPSAPGYFSPHLAKSGSVTLSRSILENRNAFGFGSKDAARIIATNARGQYDALRALGFGRAATIKIGSKTGNYASMQPIFSGRVSAVKPARGTCEFVWRGRSDLLDKPISEGAFAGTNDNISIFYEGTQEGIGGQKKKRCGGYNYNIEPVLVNSGLRIFCWRWNKAGQRIASAILHQVRVSGAVWTFDADYPTIDAMRAAGPVNGHYVTCLAESALMMGGSVPLSGGVRIDVTAQSNAADRYASNLAKELILEAGMTIDATAWEDVASESPYEAGYYRDSENYRAIIDGLMSSVLAWAVEDRQGAVTCGSLPDLENGEPVASFRLFGRGSGAAENDISITSLTPEFTGDDDLGIPAKEVQTTYCYNANPLSKDSIATGVDESIRDQLSQMWRKTAPSVNETVAAQYENATTLLHETWLRYAADAEQIRNRLALFYSKVRERFTLKVSLTPELAAAVSVGKLINIFHPRFGFSAGRVGFITAENINSKQQRATLRVLV